MGRFLAATVGCFTAAAGVVRGQAPNGPIKPDTVAGRPWVFEASLSAYIVPNGQSFLDPVATADQSGLHLEGRYNSEAIHAASLWLGWNLRFGKPVSVDLTPMIGGVFGSLNGVAPGAEVTVSYRTLELYSENEYVFDVAGKAGNYFYDWSQLAYSPWDWLLVGVAVQRTRLYETALDVQRGFLLGVTYKTMTLTGFVFNPDLTYPTTVITLGMRF